MLQGRNVKLGKIANIELGKTPARKSPRFWDVDKETENVWLSIADMPDGLHAVADDSKEYLSELGQSECKIVPKGTLLVSFKLTLGKLVYAGRDLCTNEAIAALYIHDEDLILKEYLYWFLIFFDWQKAAEGDVKVKGKTLNKAKLKNIDILVPPLSEQKRIVAILDKAFAEIDQAIANTEKNIQNAKELFASYLNNIFTQKGEGLEDETKLEHIIEVLTDYHANGSYKVLKEHVELKEVEDFAWMVRSTDFEKKFNNQKRFIGENAYNYLTKTKLFGGEIIMSKIGNAGKVYLMPSIETPCSLAMNLFLIRLNQEKANNEYVFRYLNSDKGKQKIAPLLKGAATQTITKDSVRSITVPLSSIEDQEKAIASLKNIEVQTDDLIVVHKRKIEALKELKQSLLQKAFEGELTSEISEVA